MGIKEIIMFSAAILIGTFILATQLQTWEFEFEPNGNSWNLQVRLKYFYRFNYVDRSIENVTSVVFAGSGRTLSRYADNKARPEGGLVVDKADGTREAISKFNPFEVEKVIEPFMAEIVNSMNTGKAFKQKLDIPFSMNPFTGIGIAFTVAGLLGVVLSLIVKAKN